MTVHYYQNIFVQKIINDKYTQKPSSCILEKLALFVFVVGEMYILLK